MPETDEAIAREMVAMISRADFAGARQFFDEGMLIAVSEERLRDVWGRAVGMYGDFDRVGEPVSGAVRGASLYDFPVVFSKGTAHQQVVIKGGKVSGTVLRPGRPTGKWEGNIIAWLLGRLRSIGRRK